MLKRFVVLVAAALVWAPAPPARAQEGCGAFDPAMPECTYTATEPGGISGFAGEPGGWRVTIVRKGLPRPLVISSAGGFEFYACGAVRPGDRVTARAGPGSGVTVGNPGICF